jgi:hypothetical protein
MASSTPRRRALSIQQIFLLLGSLNGIVLATLLFSSWQLLKDSGSATGHASITRADSKSVTGDLAEAVSMG